MSLADWDSRPVHQPAYFNVSGTISVTSLNELIWEMKSVSLQHVAFFFLLFYVVVFRRKFRNLEALTEEYVSKRAETSAKC